MSEEIKNKKKKKKALPVKEAFRILNFLFGAIMLSFSSRRYNLTSEDFPEAEASVSLRDRENSGYFVELEIQPMVNPGRMISGGEKLMVWSQTEGKTHSLGSLEVEEERGSLMAILSHNPERIFITREVGEEVETPSGKVVFDSGVIEND